MKYLISSVVSVFFLLLFSCDDGGGQLPSKNQKNKRFLESNERFKEFLIADVDKIFPDISSGLNFSDEQPCRGKSSIEINELPYEVTSSGCMYEVYEEYGDEVFRIASSIILEDGLRLVIFVAFENVGIPQTGTYYNNTYVGAFLLSAQNQFIDEYYGQFWEIDVANRENAVTATFTTDFYVFGGDFYHYAFNASGSLSCCN